ncbi:MAG: Ppx/GppA phosphatase family protein, partial [Planctomycetota bacterium]
MNASTPPSNDPESGVIAAIDIGANAIRMAVAQVLSDGRVEILEELRRGVRLGQSTFAAGRVEEEAMRAAVAILRDYQRHLETYDVRHLRIVATSSIREAQNADMFLDRVFMSTGFEVDVIDTAEEGRLTVSAVRRQAGSAVKLNRRRILIGEVGGGSTVLTVLDKGHITNSQSLALGSIRLQEILSTSYESPEHSADLIRQHIAKALASAQSSLALGRVRTFVAVGGDVRFVSHEVGEAIPNSDLYRISREALDAAVEDCVHYSPEALASRFGLSFADAETLVP